MKNKKNKLFLKTKTKKQIKRKTKKQTQKQKNLKIEQTTDNNIICSRCKYPIKNKSNKNICSTCVFELFMLSVHNLSENI